MKLWRQGPVFLKMKWVKSNNSAKGGLKRAERGLHNLPDLYPWNLMRSQPPAASGIILGSQQAAPFHFKKKWDPDA
jgi:hypothetical protein